MGVFKMKYCVVKDTIKIIDGSNNSLDTMLLNAQNAGFTDTEVEILTEEEYQARKVLEPIPPQEPTLEERLSVLETLELERMFEL